jgi:hypothetical protein
MALRGLGIDVPSGRQGEGRRAMPVHKERLGSRKANRPSVTPKASARQDGGHVINHREAAFSERFADIIAAGGDLLKNKKKYGANRTNGNSFSASHAGGSGFESLRSHQ